MDAGQRMHGPMGTWFNDLGVRRAAAIFLPLTLPSPPNEASSERVQMKLPLA